MSASWEQCRTKGREDEGWSRPERPGEAVAVSTASSRKEKGSLTWDCADGQPLCRNAFRRRRAFNVCCQSSGMVALQVAGRVSGRDVSSTGTSQAFFCLLAFWDHNSQSFRLCITKMTPTFSIQSLSCRYQSFLLPLLAQQHDRDSRASRTQSGVLSKDILCDDGYGDPEDPSARDIFVLKLYIASRLRVTSGVCCSLSPYTRARVDIPTWLTLVATSVRRKICPQRRRLETLPDGQWTPDPFFLPRTWRANYLAFLSSPLHGSHH